MSMKTEERSGKQGNGPIAGKEKTHKEHRDWTALTRYQAEKSSQMTALRFQTGGRHLTSSASLLGKEDRLHRYYSSLHIQPTTPSKWITDMNNNMQRINWCMNTNTQTGTVTHVEKCWSFVEKQAIYGWWNECQHNNINPQSSSYYVLTTMSVCSVSTLPRSQNVLTVVWGFMTLQKSKLGWQLVFSTWYGHWLLRM